MNTNFDNRLTELRSKLSCQTTGLGLANVYVSMADVYNQWNNPHHFSIPCALRFYIKAFSVYIGNSSADCCAYPMRQVCTILQQHYMHGEEWVSKFTRIMPQCKPAAATADAPREIDKITAYDLWGLYALIEKRCMC